MSADTFEFTQGTRDTLRGTLHDPQATTGDVLTVQPDKSIAAAPGGGSTPVQTAYYSGNSQPLDAGASALITIDSFGGPDDLLDLTDPVNPTVRTSGIYVVIATFGDDTTTPTGIVVSAVMGFGFFAALNAMLGPVGATGVIGLDVSVTGVGPMAAGEALTFSIFRAEDGGPTISYNIVNLYIAKIGSYSPAP